MRHRRFIQCDVFTSVPTKGNGLAVVVDSDGLLSDEMQELAIWTNLAETAFILPPIHPMADYKLRIFSASGEMLFAGHPTLGSCAAWLHCGLKPKSPGVVRQECRVGLVDIDLTAEVPEFAAPETNVGPLEPERLHAILDALELTIDQVVRSAHLSNGSNWQIVELPCANDVLRVKPFKERNPEVRGVGLIGRHRPGSECHFEVRNLGPASTMSEDPITGSMNAAIACWMYGEGHWTSKKTISQGTALARKGRVYLRSHQGAVWVGGESHILIDGHLLL